MTLAASYVTQTEKHLRQGSSNYGKTLQNFVNNISHDADLNKYFARKQVELTNLYNSDSGSERCTIASTNILSFSKWFPINCSTQIQLPYIICERESAEMTSSLQSNIFKRSEVECAKKEIYINYRTTELCCKLRMTFTDSSKSERIVQSKHFAMYVRQIYAFHLKPYLSRWTSGYSSEVLYWQLNKTHALCLKRLCAQCPHAQSSDWMLEGVCLLHTKSYWLVRTLPIRTISAACLPSLHECEDGTCILNQYVCDNTADCLDGSDENHCTHVCTQAYNCLIHCPEIQCTCNVMYLQISGRCVPLHLLYTELLLVHNAVEWELSGSDSESQDTQNTCLHHQPRCTTQNNDSCYPYEKTCTFERNIYGKVLHCENTEHITNCMDHQCPTMFRCPDSYCVPLHVVCDMVDDCPNGDDEHRLDCKYKCN